MRPARAVLDLSPGAGVVLDGTQWTVERREPHLGRVQLVASDGVRQQVSFRFLANHPGCRPSSRTASAGADRGRQSKAPREWQEILRTLPRPRFERNPRLDDCARQGASAFVWAHITQGEPRFAPRPIVLSHAHTESDRHPWPTKCNNMWFHIGAASTSYYAALRTLLIEVSEDLARKIDCDWSR
jgi:hypothetical protein